MLRTFILEAGALIILPEMFGINGVWWAISGQNIDTGYWWLRSPDSEYYFCAEIYELGSIGSGDTIEIEGVRPAIEVRTLN